jgi:Uma2 family endonuclease
MRAVWIGIPESFLEERHRNGQDKRDEVWDGELHMSPPPSAAHQRQFLSLAGALIPVAARRGLEVWGATGLFEHADNYRIPDILIARVEHASKRGVEGAELVIEILSPTSEAREKRPFYASRGVKEIWLIDPITYAFEILSLIDDRYITVHGGRSPLLDVELATLPGTAPKLRISDGDHVVDV